MPTLTIDKRTVTVPDGTKVIKAAEQAGIMIPRFCYHPALGSVGACRVCAVGFIEGPVKGVEMSCMMDAQEGMVVATDHPQAVDFRRHVIELLMLNHPHDCPVCDEGGHCLLQDTTISGGHGRRRYQGLKRTHSDQDLGPLVQHEMNRCIQCYRCARYYQEYTGYRDLGVTGIGSRVYFGRSQAGTLESPFAGNLTDICPTGVFTDKPSRFYGRRWDYERAPSICLHCSLGCNLTVSARYRKVVRHEARVNPQVNGHFICDRGRYGYAYASLAERPRRALSDGRPIRVAAALHEVTRRLEAVVAASGSDGVAMVGGFRSSLETQALMAHLCKRKTWQAPCWTTDDAAAATTEAALKTLNADNTASLGDIEAADTIVVLGADPLGEGPMLALALRQARRRGARIITIDPRPVRLPCEHEHLAVHPADLATAVKHLVVGALEPSREIGLNAERQAWFNTLRAGARDIEAADRLRTLGRQLTNAWRPAFVCGTAIVGPEVPPLLAVLQEVVKISCMWSGLHYLLPGANSFGAQLFAPSPARHGFSDLVEAMERDHLKALVVVENDLFSAYADAARLEAALGRLDLLVVLDCLASEMTRRADIFLPTQTIYEAGGRFINNEGRLQQAQAVMAGGRPLAETGMGDHPPREFASHIPGQGPLPAWRLLWDLISSESAPDMDAAEVEGLLREALGASAAFVKDLNRLTPGDRIYPPAEAEASVAVPEALAQDKLAAKADGITLIETEVTFGSERLSSVSAALSELTAEPFVKVHPETAAALGWRADARIEFPAAKPELSLRVVADGRTASGVVVVPRLIGRDRMALRRWADGLKTQ